MSVQTRVTLGKHVYKTLTNVCWGPGVSMMACVLIRLGRSHVIAKTLGSKVTGVKLTLMNAVVQILALTWVSIFFFSVSLCISLADAFRSNGWSCSMKYAAAF